MQKVVEQREIDIRQEVLNNRLRGFKRKRLDPNSVASTLFDPKNSIEDLVKCGYVDEVATLEEIIARDLDNTKKSNFSLNGRFGLWTNS